MKNSNNCRYEVKRTVGHKLDGTPIRKSFYGKSKREAKQKADDWIIQNGKDAKEVYPVRYLVIQKAAESGVVNCALAREWSDERNAQPFENVMYHELFNVAIILF